MLGFAFSGFDVDIKDPIFPHTWWSAVFVLEFSMSRRGCLGPKLFLTIFMREVYASFR